MLLILVTHATETYTRLDFSNLGNFSGSELKRGRVWTLVTSAFLHGSWGHAVEQVGLLLITTAPAEAALNGHPVVFLAMYLGAGSVGVIVGWLQLRRSLTKEIGEYGAATADLAWSRGASANTAAAAGMSVVLAAQRGYASLLGLGPWRPWVEPAVLILGLVAPDYFRSTARLGAAPVRGSAVLVAAVLVLGAVPGMMDDAARPLSLRGPRVQVWAVMAAYYALKAASRAWPMLRAAVKHQSWAAVDYAAHVAGAAAGAAVALVYVLWAAESVPQQQVVGDDASEGNGDNGDVAPHSTARVVGCILAWVVAFLAAEVVAPLWRRSVAMKEQEREMKAAPSSGASKDEGREE